MTELNREQAIDILDKFDFFQGQRAGRDLWNSKSFDVQEQDIANFSRDVTLLKNYINKLTEENERLRAEQSKIKRKVLMEAASKFAGHSDYHGDAILCKLICMSEGKEVGVATPIDEVRRKETKADTVRKMQERLTLEFDRMHKNNFMTPEVRQWIIDQIAKEIIEGETKWTTIQQQK